MICIILSLIFLLYFSHINRQNILFLAPLPLFLSLLLCSIFSYSHKSNIPLEWFIPQRLKIFWRESHSGLLDVRAPPYKFLFNVIVVALGYCSLNYLCVLTIFCFNHSRVLANLPNPGGVTIVYYLQHCAPSWVHLILL